MVALAVHFSFHWTEVAHLWRNTDIVYVDTHLYVYMHMHMYLDFTYEIVWVWSELDITVPLSPKFVNRCVTFLENLIWMSSHSIRMPHFVFHPPGFPFSIQSFCVSKQELIVLLCTWLIMADWWVSLGLCRALTWKNEQFNHVRTFNLFHKKFHCWKYIFKKIIQITLIQKIFCAPEISVQVLKAVHI